MHALKKDGTSAPRLKSVAPPRVTGGPFAELEALVRERTAALEQANSELESFAYSVSHDLRAPIRAISGFADAALEDGGDSLDPAVRRHLHRVRDAATRMNDLTVALLDLARVARAPIARQRVDVSGLARAIIEEQRLRDRTHDVEVIIEDALVVEADRTLTTALLQNLLDNAWKFTSGRTHARIVVGRDGPWVFIRDDGIGFDHHRVDRIFEPFQRLCSAKEFEGTGIGLATALRIVRRHGGAIYAESEPGNGATFRFTLHP